VPDWLLIILMILASYRLTRFVVRDTFPPILWVRDRLAGGYRDITEPEWKEFTLDHPEVHEGDDGHVKRYVHRASWSPYWLAELLSCPWCASAYVSGAVVLATDLTTGVPLPWLAGLATWAGAAWMLSKEKV
jgi:hypothetical protein